MALIPYLGFWAFGYWFPKSIGSMFYRSWDEWAHFNRYSMVYVYPTRELWVRENGGPRVPLDEWMSQRRPR